MLSQIANNITDLQKMKVKAGSDKELAEINRQLEEAHDRRAIIVAESGNRVASFFTAGMRAHFAAPVAIFLWKWRVWDKVVGSLAKCAGSFGNQQGNVPDRCATFITDRVDDNTWWIILGVCGFYFAYDFGKRALGK